MARSRGKGAEARQRHREPDDQAAIETRLELDPAALEQVLKIATDLHHRIPGSPPPSAEALLSLPGVLRQAQADQQEERVAAAAVVRPASRRRWRIWCRPASPRASGSPRPDPAAGESPAVRDRRNAGRRATRRAARPNARQPAGLAAGIARLSEERIAQEVALLASRSDVREELDRLFSDIAAVHHLMAGGGEYRPQLDF